MAIETLKKPMTGDEMIALSKKHTLFEWSAQSKVDPIPVERAKGIYFWTPEGKRFIDFNSQLMCVNIGHGDERVIKAIHDQASVLAYANPFMATEARARLGAKLAEITPGDIDVFFFTNGGAEANENAIKLARMASGRHKILARYRSYHGATAGSITLTGDPRRWAAEPGIPGVVHVLDPYHGIARGWDTAAESLAIVKRTISRVPLSNPIRRFRERLDRDLPTMQQRGLNYYHAWAFASVRQVGTAFELAAANLEWLTAQGAGDFSAPTSAFRRIAESNKALILKAARSVNSRKPLDTATLFADQEQAWDEGMSGLRAKFPA